MAQVKDRDSDSLHNCKLGDDFIYGGYGIAINECWQDEKDGELWVSNGEYSNTVKFCPFCGFSPREVG